ncbi:hypothetical protein ACUR5C_15060 [Aliikangiella sp. IMCC44653]
MNQDYLNISNVLAKKRNEPVIVILEDKTEYRFCDFCVELADKNNNYEITAWGVESVSDGKSRDMEFFELSEINEIRDALSGHAIYKKAS